MVDTDELYPGRIFYNKYKLLKKIGEGSFGKIWKALNINNSEELALKLEDRNEKNSLLESESYVMAYLKGKGIPAVKSYGYSGSWNILVMELLGKSLDFFFSELNEKFSLKTTMMLGLQMVSIYYNINIYIYSLYSL